MDDLLKHPCNNCGPKEACLFAPSELRKNVSYCIKCIAARRKARAISNPVPAHTEGYRFNGNYERGSR